MPITRVPSLLEQSIKSNAGGTNPEVRNQLEVYSTNEVDNLINAIDLTPYATNSTVASISGSLNSDINALETTVVEVSGNLTIDINNLDISLTQSIVDYVTIDGTTPAVSATPAAWGKIEVISGGPYWIALYQ